MYLQYITFYKWINNFNLDWVKIIPVCSISSISSLEGSLQISTKGWMHINLLSQTTTHILDGKATVSIATQKTQEALFLKYLATSSTISLQQFSCCLNTALPTKVRKCTRVSTKVHDSTQMMCLQKRFDVFFSLISFWRSSSSCFLSPCLAKNEVQPFTPFSIPLH